MLAAIAQAQDGYTVRFERNLKHDAGSVWSMLTDNEKLATWFPELRVADLREGGLMTFDMQNGEYEEMEIIAFERLSVLEYTWAEDAVRFELFPEPEGCRLVLIEKITKITEHTPRDIAGWDVCLDVIEALLDGRTIASRKDVWKMKYNKYVQAFANLPQA
ncbi:SRPBCC family protein [Bacillus sp. FJAT-28004]|uniref:SRPBCC family protein n=1 Tax=Bacillus sp. FJAT-28004 TaxID=1679165 RepID=UPI0006B4ADAB|nr:SRPBCC family protein [Bacillus sp. FJAT-28004]